MKHQEAITLLMREGASEKAIRSQYLKLAGQYHPDKKNISGDASEENFKIISTVFDAIKHNGYQVPVAFSQNNITLQEAEEIYIKQLETIEQSNLNTENQLAALMLEIADINSRMQYLEKKPLEPARVPSAEMNNAPNPLPVNDTFQNIFQRFTNMFNPNKPPDYKYRIEKN
jgi:hypothetical protein